MGNSLLHEGIHLSIHHQKTVSLTPLEISGSPYKAMPVFKINRLSFVVEMLHGRFEPHWFAKSISAVQPQALIDRDYHLSACYHSEII